MDSTFSLITLGAHIRVYIYSQSTQSTVSASILYSNQSDKLISFAATFHAVCHHIIKVLYIYPLYPPDANHFPSIAEVFICLSHRSHDTAVFVIDYLHKSVW